LEKNIAMDSDANDLNERHRQGKVASLVMRWVDP